MKTGHSHLSDVPSVSFFIYAKVNLLTIDLLAINSDFLSQSRQI